DRDILRLAVPSLGALIAEPLFLMTDSAFIARVSTVSLAGLGLASAVLTTVIGLSVFLAYSTTASVARAFGAARRQEAIAPGVAEAERGGLRGRGDDPAWLGAALRAAAGARRLGDRHRHLPMGDGGGAAAPGGTGRPPSRGAPAPAPGPGRLRRARIGADVRAHRVPARGAAGRDPGRDPPGRSAAGRPPDRADSVHAAVARAGLPGDRRAGPD